MKKERIEETAKLLFFEKGIADTSINDITRSSNIAKGTFYTYFKDKNDLIYQIAKKEQIISFQSFITTAKEHLCTCDHTWCQEVGVLMIDEFFEHPDFLRFIYQSMLAGYLPKYSNLLNYSQHIPILEEFLVSCKKPEDTLEQTAHKLTIVYQMVTFSCFSAHYINMYEDKEQAKQYIREHTLGLLN